jgi:hypothetical protein
MADSNYSEFVKFVSQSEAKAVEKLTDLHLKQVTASSWNSCPNLSVNS